jgi:hypothetical protein
MAIPPLNFIEPRAAVQRVCAKFECNDEQEAVKYLCDKLRGRAIIPQWESAATPSPDDVDFSKIDWVSGAMVIAGTLGPAVNTMHGRTPGQWSPGSRYPFKIDRRQLENVLKEGDEVSSETDDPEPLPGALKGTPGPKSTGQLVAACVATLYEKSLSERALGERPIPTDMKEIFRFVLRDAGYGAGELPRGWSAPTLSKYCGLLIDEERRKRAAKKATNR